MDNTASVITRFQALHRWGKDSGSEAGHPLPPASKTPKHPVDIRVPSRVDVIAQWFFLLHNFFSFPSPFQRLAS